MAQTGYTPILIYSSSTTTNAPSAGNLTNSTLGSELAINITDGKLFYKDNANAVQVIAWKTTPTTAGGTGLTSYTAGDLLYYASGTTLTKLGIGSAYQALQVNAGGTAPSWQASATSTLTAQGDLLYASAANTLARLAKNTTATRYLSNTGSNNNPAWAQVDLTNGVTGVLPNGNTTGATAATANTLLLRDGSGNGTVATINCSFVSNTGNYQQAYGKELDSTTSGGSTSHMMSYQTWSGNANTLVVGNTFGPVVFATGGGTMTEKAQLHTSGGFSLGDATDPGAGNFRLGTGNLVVGTSGKGIDFSANANAPGMTSELLTWYEEGTFTPSVTSGGTSITYVTQSGHYTRIGRQVFYRLNIAISAATANGSAFKVGGLPFTCGQSGGGYFAYDNGSWVNSTSTNLPTVFVASGGTTIEFYTTAGAAVVGTDLNALGSANFYIIGQYIV